MRGQLNRVWLVANLLLTVFLVICIAPQLEFDTVRAATGPKPLRAEDLRVLRVDDDRLMLTFRAPMVEAARVGGEPAEVGLTLEPENRLLGVWHDTETLELTPARPLRRATRYTIHFGRALAATNGRVAPQGLQKAFETPSIAVSRLVVDGEHATDEHAFVVGFDLPVDAASLREKLEVTSHGRPVAAVVTDLQLADEHAYRVTLRSESNLDSVDVCLHAGLRPRRGDVAMPVDFRQRVVFREPLRITAASFRRGAIELGFNRTFPLPGRGQIQLDPALPFQIFRTHRGLRLVGDFEPGSTLSVRLAPGFPGSGRTVMEKGARRSLMVPEATPELDFAQRGSVLSSLARPELEIRGVNVAEFGFSIRRLYTNNVLRHVQSRGRDTESMFEPPRKTRFEIGAARNKTWTQRVELKDLLDGRTTGIFRVGIWDEANRARSKTRILQVTDLGVTFRASPSAVAVQVRSIATGKPVAGAAIQVVTPTNQELTTGSTDGDGIVVLPFAKTAADRVPFLVQVRKDEDTAFVDLKGHAIELTDETLSGRPYLTSGFEAWVRPSRGILRPGETFESTVIVRDREGIAPSGLKLVAVLRAPRGREWSRQRLELPGAGLVRVSQRISPDAPTGAWQLVVRSEDEKRVLGSAAFTVQAFVPNRLEAEVHLEEPMRIGATTSVRVRGRWLDGAPASRRPVVLRVRLDRGSFRATEFDEFSFTREVKQTPPGALRPIRAVLDERGEALVRVAVPAKVAMQAMTARITAEVVDPSGRGVFESIVEPVLRQDFHLGIRQTPKGAEIVSVDAAGQVVRCEAPCEFAVEWRRYEWDMVRHRGGWRYRTEVLSEQIDEQTVDLRSGRAVVKPGKALPKRAGGWFVFVARCGDRVCEASATRRPGRPDRLRVRGPAVAVAPGETARIEVDAPADGRGFLTLEGHGIHTARAIAIARGNNEIEIAIPDGMDLPNVHAVVTLIRPTATKGDPGPFWLVGGASIPLHHANRSTAVELSGPTEVRPESQTDFAIHAPGATKATVALVDEGVLNLTRHTDPDPLAFFLARRRLDSRGADNGGFLMNGVRYRPGVQTGGDGGSGLSPSVFAGSVNSRIRPVALFAEVVLDASGRGRARFELPSYEGRLRVMVAAAGPKVVGAASRALLVKAPLGLQVAMPRMLQPGDRAVVPVTFKNNTEAAGTVRFTCAPADGIEVERDGLVPAIDLTAGEVRTVDVALRVAKGKIGDRPRLRVRARLANHRREVVGETFVRRPAVFARDVVGLRFEGEQEFAFDDRWTDREVRVRLRVDASPDAQLRGALQSLLDYPHGCLEQTTSRCMGLLSCQSMLPAIMGKEAPQASAMLQAGVDRIFSMQCHDGGFAWWPGQDRSYPYGTVHALDFLLEAKTLGAEIPEAALRHAIDALAKMVARKDDVSLRCHAIEVLSRAGRPVVPWLDFLAAAAILPDDRARVAMAMARRGETARARALLDHREFATGRSAPMLRSEVRDRAMQLRARVELGDLDATALSLARYLGRVMARPQRFNTQEKAQALRALAAYYRVSGAQREDDSVSVTVRQGAGKWTVEDGILEITADPRRPLRTVSRGTAFGWIEVSGQRTVDTEISSEDLGVRFQLADVDTGRPVARFRRGRTYEVVVRLSAPKGLENFLVTQLLPGGFEVEQPRPHHTRRRGGRPMRYIERRDDRVLVFVPGRVHGDVEFRYRLRAVFPGSYAVPPVRVEAMYEPELRATTEASTPVVIEP